MPNKELDFLEQSGRFVLTDGLRGRKYYNLGGLEKALCTMDQVNKTRAYMTYDRKMNEMKLVMDVETGKDSFVNLVRNYAGEQMGEGMVPAVVNIVSEQE